MIPRTLRQLADITGGSIHLPGADPVGRGTTDEGGDLLVSGPVVTDSREAGPGSLYVARIGEHLDGHDFIADAAAQGAVAALVERATGPLPAVVVPDVQAAFAAIARDQVDRHPDLTVIGITGSSGKTSTKDLLAGVLAGAGPTVAPVGSLNSEVGVPLTLCRVTQDTRFLVVEMGARGAGHIAYLTDIAPPRIGVVLNVGLAHVGEFGSREAIGRAKSELVRALPPRGLAVLNGDDTVVAAMAERTPARVVRFGTAADADVRAVDVRLDADARARFTLETPTGSVPVALGLHGAHHVANALAVAAVALEVGLTPDRVATALGAARPVSRWRMQVTQRADGVTVVNDAYNANPGSMRAALGALAAMTSGRRSWAVLGTMLELGALSAAEHRGVGRAAAEAGIDRVVVVGEEARPMVEGVADVKDHADACPTRVVWVRDAEAAEALLSRELTGGDVVLFKSSRDAGLRLLGDRVCASTSEDLP